MNCKEFSNLLDAYADGALSPAEAGRMRDHAAACPDCAARLTLLQDARRAEEEIQVPDGFSSSWRRMIREEEKMMKQATEKKAPGAFHWKTWLAAAAALAFLFGGTLMSRDALPARTARISGEANQTWSEPSGAAVSRKANAAGADAMYDMRAAEAPMLMAAYGGADYEMAEESMAEADSGQQEKIIRSASFTLKTTQFDLDLEALQSLARQMGGRVEYLSSSGDASTGQTRSASLTLRIPAQQLDGFLSGVEGIGTVTAMTQEMEDVSASYYDVQTRLKTQQEKLARLQAMIASAEDVSDLIEIESAIADAQYYIDRYTSQLKSYDGKVDYSTVRATVREVKITELVDVTLGQRIISGLTDSLENGAAFFEDMAVFLISALPWLAAAGAGIAIIKILVKKIKKNRKKEG